LEILQKQNTALIKNMIINDDASDIFIDPRIKRVSEG